MQETSRHEGGVSGDTSPDAAESSTRRGLSDDPEAVVDPSVLRRQAAFVGITFVGMIGGLLAGWFGASSSVVWGLYALAYVFGGWYGLKESIEAIQEPAVEIDLLMILAALGAAIIGAPFEGAMLLFLFSLATVLEEYATGRSRSAITALMEIRPESAQLLRGDEEVTVPIEDVEIGDVFVVRPGDRLPLDGVVRSGESSVDQSSLTGESVPIPKEPGDEVFGGTINETGSLEVEVTKLAHESAISRLIHMVEEAQNNRAPTQRLIDRLEQPYVLGVFAMTLVAIALPLILWDSPFDSTFYRAMTLMVAASPCAVIISTPAAVLSSITAGARQGVLFKGGKYVEAAATINAVAFDKTGTLTEGNTQLTDAVPRERATVDGKEVTTSRLLELAAAVQSRSEHHLAEATIDAATERSLEIPESSGFEAVVGKGVHAKVADRTAHTTDADRTAHAADRTIHIGNSRYVETVLGDATIDGLDEGLAAVRALEADGKTSVLVISESDDGLAILGWLAFTDTLRESATEMIDRLRELGIEHVVMLTGDNERVARAIADELGIDDVRAELLPEQKVEAVTELQERYSGVVMVGDGVNDAPALATADVSVGMGGAGTDVALETADIVLMSDDLDKLPYALTLSRKTRKTLFLNLSIAFGAILIMVAAILTAGIPLPVAVIGHEGSTVLVSLIGLRLIGFQG